MSYRFGCWRTTREPMSLIDYASVFTGLMVSEYRAGISAVGGRQHSLFCDYYKPHSRGGFTANHRLALHGRSGSACRTRGRRADREGKPGKTRGLDLTDGCLYGNET